MKPNIVTVISGYLTLAKKGREHLGICPFHEDTNASLSVNEGKEIFKCFACGASGDVYDFVQKIENIGYQECLEKLGETPLSNKPVKPKAKDIVIITPVPADAPPCNGLPNKRPSDIYEYQDENGGLVGMIYRYDEKDGKKTFTPFVYTDKGWQSKAFPTPRPLFNLPLIMEASPETKIMLVEGEKTAKAAARLFTKAVVTTWAFGANAYKHINFRPLYGKTVVLCPDNDPPGIATMIAIGETLLKYNCTVYLFTPPDTMPPKWDWADFKQSPAEANKLLGAHTEKFVPNAAPVVTPPVIANTNIEDISFDEYFKILGLKTDAAGKLHILFFDNRNGILLTRDATKLTPEFLLTLAPLDAWVAMSGTAFAFKSKMFNLRANDAIISAAKAMGTVDESIIRGRGVWRDEDSIVINSGRLIHIDGKPAENNFTRNFIYEKLPDIHLVSKVDLLTQKECDAFVECAELANWEDPVSAMLISGWAFLSPLCGIAEWRPHIWIIGQPGSGKSWLLNYYVRAALGNVAIFAQGNTTEAALRQTLKNDALPILIDEADAYDQAGQMRMQNILSLARASSSRDGGSIIKGSQNQSGSMKFSAKAMFAFAGVAPQILNEADATRITLLSLNSPNTLPNDERVKRFADMQKIMKELGYRFAERFVKTAISRREMIEHNITEMNTALMAKGIARRATDQIAGMVAAHCALKEIELNEKRANYIVLNHLKYSETIFGEKNQSDNIVDYLLSFVVTGDGHASMTFARMIAEAMETESDIEQKNILNRLRNYGIDYDIKKNKIFVSARNAYLNNLFARTQWGANYNVYFAMTTEAEKNIVRSINGKSTRGTFINNPIETIKKDETLF